MAPGLGWRERQLNKARATRGNGKPAASARMDAGSLGGAESMRSMEGVVTILQESRFQLTDDAGVSHLFILAHDTLGEPDQLEPLQRRQARVRVRYTAPRNIIGLVAHSIETQR